MHGKQNNIKVWTALSACKKYFVIKLLFCNNGGPVRKGLPQSEFKSYKSKLYGACISKFKIVYKLP